MTGFAAASLAPSVLLVLAASLGGLWIWLALGYITAFPVIMDRLAARATAPVASEFPAGTGLLVILSLCHLALLPLAVWAIAGPGALSLPERAAAFIAFGLAFGQISNAVAHELIHRHSRWLHRLGILVYITLLFGHHASAHRHVHHRHVGTRHDPNTSRRGESFYTFLRRAWIGSFRAGLAAENARRRPGPHPYVIYIGGAAFCCAAALALAGPRGLLVYAALAAYATSLLLLSDYVQHYGLVRRLGPDDRPEPVAPRHSWNAAPPFSAAMLLNAPRHSDHHTHPARAFPALVLPPDAPLLPRSLAVMATIALIPPLWRRVMHPRLDHLARASREREAAGAGAARADLAG